MPPPNLMFTLFRARNQTVECYIDHYYGRPAIASPAPLLRHAGVHRPHLDAARSTGSPRRARIAGPTAQRLLRPNTKSAQLLPASCRRNLRPRARQRPRHRPRAGGRHHRRLRHTQNRRLQSDDYGAQLIPWPPKPSRLRKVKPNGAKKPMCIAA